jgi:CheY-like chemotaxis protein/nitrogen-specific signal transduction histidine kinase
VVPIYAVYLIRFHEASNTISGALLLLQILSTIFNISTPLVASLIFILTILTTPPKILLNKHKYFISRISSPYFIFDSSLQVSSHNSSALKLPFYACNGNIKSKLQLTTLDNGCSLYNTLKDITKKEAKQISGSFECSISQFTDGNMQCNKYEVHFIKLGSKIYVSFTNITSDFILKQKAEYERLKLRITSTISHELRNPLNGIVGIFSHLKQVVNKDTQKITLKGISLSYLLRYKIDSFIDLVQIMSKEISLNYFNINIDSFLKRIQKTFAPLIDNSTTLIIKKDELLPKSFIQDEERLTQIIVQLINNALKYTSNGSVTFEICLRTEGEIQFIVADTGCGMDSKTINAIRKSAVSLIPDAVVREGISLSGLGLGTVQLLLEKMGGKLEIESALKKGTAFSFIMQINETSRPLRINRFKFSSMECIPKIKVKTKTHRQIPDEFNEEEGIYSPISKFPAAINKKNAKILKRMSSNIGMLNTMIVDDCCVNRMVHKMFLEKYANLKITEHCNGLEAVEYLKVLSKNTPQKVLILMDINMPIMDGIEATKAIRQIGYPFPISIIAVSAFSNEDDLKKIVDCGMDYYITKPITKEKLSKILTLMC